LRPTTPPLAYYPGVLEQLGALSRKLQPSRSKVRAGRAISLGAMLLGAKPLRIVELSGGALVEVDLRSRTEAQVFWNGSFEPDYLECLNGLMDRMGGVAYDIGANVGLIAIPVAHHVRGRHRVVAFEPVRENHARLVASAALNRLTADDLLALPFGLAAENATVRMSREAAFGASTGNARLLRQDEVPGVHGCPTNVMVRRLDDLVDELSLPLPTLIKIDVEGAESHVFEGAQATLRESRPVILGEFNSRLMPLFGTTFPDAAALLPANYRIFSFLARDVVKQCEPKKGLGDVLMVPVERVKDLPVRIADE
jgi:FkbM family methyltransferase